MTAFDFPGDLLAAQRDFFAAELLCEEISSRLPPASAIVVGAGAEITEEQHAELAAAPAELQRLARYIIGHDWWSTTDRTAARAAQREAARR